MSPSVGERRKEKGKRGEPLLSGGSSLLKVSDSSFQDGNLVKPSYHKRIGCQAVSEHKQDHTLIGCGIISPVPQYEGWGLLRQRLEHYS